MSIRFLAAPLVIFLALALGSTLTKRPWVDEAWFASPAYDLASHGRMGTHVLEPRGSHLSVLNPAASLERIDQHTYWVMPLHLLVLACSFKIAGFSLTVMRLPAVLWGLAALLAWYVIVRRLGGSRALGGLAVLLIGVDYAFVNSASDGRMDMMCASLGYLALAAYLQFRETRLMTAVRGPAGAKGQLCDCEPASSDSLRLSRVSNRHFTFLPTVAQLCCAPVGSDGFPPSRESLRLKARDVSK